MRSVQILAPGPEGRPGWMRLYVQPIGAQWAAMIVGDKASPPQPGQLRGIVFAGDTVEDAERLALRYLAGREGVSRGGVGEGLPKALKGTVGELGVCPRNAFSR